MATSTGTLRYSPKLLGDYRKSSKYWLVLDCDPELGRYFRHLYHVTAWKCRKLIRPAWAEHVTVIRDEPPPEDKRHLWEKHAGIAVDFMYEPVVYSDDVHFWLPVHCEQLLDIREELGLRREPGIPLHVTIGNKHDEVPSNIPSPAGDGL